MLDSSWERVIRSGTNTLIPSHRRVISTVVAAIVALIATSAPRLVSQTAAASTSPHLSVSIVSQTFDRAGLPLCRIRISPALRGEVDLVNVNKSFSLTVTIFDKDAQATLELRDLGPLWRREGWPSRVLRNVLIGVQPAGRKPGQHAPMWPMPRQVMKALQLLANH